MTMGMIVGISGVAGSGKDSLARFLVEDHGFTVVSLADPLKRICREVFDFSDEQLWGPSEKRNEPDKRYPKDADLAHFSESVISGLGVEGYVQPQGYLTPRYALQQLGTEWGRNCYGNVWVEYAMRIAQNLTVDPEDGSVPHYSQKRGLTYQPLGPYRMPQGVAIPDVRFRNEIDGIRKAGGKVIRIRRPGAGLAGAAGLHPSEAEQAGIPDGAFDCVVENDGTLETLRAKAASVLANLRP